MNLDELENGQRVEADVCVVGAGPAGMALAASLAKSRVRLCVVESGDLEFDDAHQSLAEGEIIGRPTQNLRTERNRQFGGSGNSWAGSCAPMSAIDFEAKRWLRSDGWPFSYPELEPFYHRAQKMFGIGSFNYEPEFWAGGGLRFLDADPRVLETRIWQLSPCTNFGHAYHDLFRNSQRISVLLRATATDILSNDATTKVTGIEVRSLAGKRATVTANAYVLACGGIDNARLLLCSRSRAPTGLGNTFGVVGRYFMQHPHIGAASVRFLNSRKWVRSYKDLRVHDVWIRARLGLSADAQKRLKILNAVASVINRYVADSLTHAQSVGYLATKRLALEIAHGRIPNQLPGELTKIARDLPGLVSGSWRHLRHQTGALYFMSEQMPHPDSRVMLGDDLDAFGLEQARVDWRLSPIDKRTIRLTVETIAAELKRLHVAKVEPDEWLMADDVSWPESLNGGFHHMGTTRMGSDRRTSVVDSNAQVHGIDNLYVAGSSIFPTGGCANPTLTLVATSLKLADHLSRRLNRTSPSMFSLHEAASELERANDDAQDRLVTADRQIA